MKNKNPVLKVEKYMNVNGEWFALVDKKKIPMPAEYSEMYDNDHLAIQLRSIAIFDSEDLPKEHYVPLFTAETPDWRD